MLKDEVSFEGNGRVEIVSPPSMLLRLPQQAPGLFWFCSEHWGCLDSEMTYFFGAFRSQVMHGIGIIIGCRETLPCQV
jgi:hypothetical protein